MLYSVPVPPTIVPVLALGAITILGLSGFLYSWVQRDTMATWIFLVLGVLAGAATIAMSAVTI